MQTIDTAPAVIGAIHPLSSISGRYDLQWLATWPGSRADPVCTPTSMIVSIRARLEDPGPGNESWTRTGRTGGELVGRRDRSGLAPDVDLVCLEDQIGAALPMAEQYRDQRRAKVSDCVDVISAFRSLQPGHEVIDVARELIDGATGEGP